MLEQFSNSILFFRKKPEIWYSVKDGSWSDSSTWSSAGKNNRTRLPRAIDTVVIATRVTVDQNVTVANVYGQTGGIIFDTAIARTFTCNNSFYYGGILNMSGGGTTTHNLVLNGVDNYIENSLFNTGTGSIVTYSKGDQTIVNVTYRNLYIIRYSPSIINSVSVITVNNELRLYDTGSNFTGNASFICLGAYRNLGSVITSLLLELRGGIGNTASPSTFNNTVNFTTNSQSFNGGAGSTFNGNVNIVGAITITHNPGQESFFNGILNGDNAGSIFDNRFTISYLSATAPMVTGQLQCNNASNTFRYNRTGNQDVKSGTYRTLTFGGSGVKTLLGNIIINTASGGSVSRSGCTINYNGFTIQDSLGNNLTP